MTTLQDARGRLATRRTERTEPAILRPGPVSFYLIAAATVLLLIIGVVMVLSASSIVSLRANDGNPFADFLSQARFALIGVPLAFIASRISVIWYKRLAWFALIGTLGMQSLIFTPLARGAGGNTNWILIPGTGQTIQPSEFLKIGLALWLGLFLSKYADRLRDWRFVLGPLLVAGVALGLVMAGHDMGTAIVIVLLVFGAFLVAGVPWQWFVGLIALGVAGAVALVIQNPSRTTRILHFLGIGEADPTGAGYQSQHGLFGLGTGGIWGVGLGASREKWAYLPEAHNDFIFAILGEEVGLLGTMVVLLLFGVLALGLFRVIRNHPDPFVKVSTAAVLFWIVGQAFINMGVVITLLPVIGVPLPLVSAGGSALISTLVALGIMLSFARSEPGAAAALSVTGRSVRRSLAVVGERIGSGLGRNRRG